MKSKDFEAFQRAWENYPSQDNEGYVPDRGGFKAAWEAALKYRDRELGNEYAIVCHFKEENEKLRTENLAYKQLEEVARQVHDDEETGHWGPDITMKAVLAKALAAIDALRGGGK